MAQAQIALMHSGDIPVDSDRLAILEKMLIDLDRALELLPRRLH